MAVDEAEVRRIARLAKLEYPAHSPDQLMDEATVKRLATDLGQILDYVRELDQLDVSSVEPTSHGVPLPTLYADDQAEPGLAIEGALSGAPARVGNSFSVPKIVE